MPFYGWVVVALTLVNQALSIGILIYSFALFVVPWIEEFGWDRGGVMLAVTGLQLGVGAASPIVGRWLDVAPARVLVTLGGALLAVGLLLVSVATEFWHVIVLYALLLPLAMAMCGTLAAQTLVANWFDRRRGLAIGISAIGTSLGGLLVPPFVGVLLGDDIGWRTTIQVLAVLTALGICPLSWWILKRPVEREAPRFSTRNIAAQTDSVLSSRQILSSPTYWIIAIALVPLNAGFGSVQFQLGALVDDLGFGAGAAATLISTASLFMILGKSAFGVLADRVDHRYLYWGAAAFMVGALTAFQGRPTWEVLLLGAAMNGLSTGAVLPLMGTICSTRFGIASFGRAVGLVNLCLPIASFAAPLAGYMFELTGSYDVAFRAFTALLVPGVVAMYWLPRPTH